MTEKEYILLQNLGHTVSALIHIRSIIADDVTIETDELNVVNAIIANWRIELHKKVKIKS